jgi:hypothetical protein
MQRDDLQWILPGITHDAQDTILPFGCILPHVLRYLNAATVIIETAQSVGATWLNRCTMPGRWRSAPMQVSVSSKWVMAAYKFLTGGN